MAYTLNDDTDVEMTRYNEAAEIKTYSGASAENVRGGFVQYDPIRKVEGVYIDLPSGGKLRVGDRPVTPKQSAQTDMVAQAQTPEPALTSKTPIPVKNGTPIENILGGANGPELDDYLAAGYTEADVQQYEKFALGNIEDLQVPMKLTPDQMAQYAQQPGAEMVMPRETSLREGVQGVISNTLDPNREPTGAIGDAISSALQSIIGQENLDDPSDVRAFSKLFTDFAGVTVPAYGGAETVDEGARTFNSGYKMISDGIASGDTNMMKIGAIDAAIGIGLTTLGVAEFVPLVNSLTDPAKNLLREASPAAKNMLADAIGASRAIAQGDKDMLMEIFQPAGTPRSLGAAAPVDTSYRMQQQPRGPQDENPIRLDDLTKSTNGEQAGYPADFYSANGPRFYAPGPQFAGDEFGQANRESYKAIMAVKGKPDAEVTIYRAVPNDPNITTINEGDFVTLSPTYAKLHGGSGYGRSGDEPGKVISQKVKVRDIYFDGNDVNEFGYFPESQADAGINRDIIGMNIKANSALAKMFEAADVTQDSPLSDIEPVLQRAVKSGMLDPRVADTMLKNSEGR
jgi:hypothetical protein